MPPPAQRATHCSACSQCRHSGSDQSLPGPHRVWDERARRECPSRTAARRAHRSRGAAPATMCTARPRTGQALTCPPTPALSPRALGLQTRCERAGRFFAAAPGRARPRRFARARAYAPGAGQRMSAKSAGGVPNVFKFHSAPSNATVRVFRGKAAVSFSETEFDASVNCVRNNLNFSLNLYYLI